MVKTIAKRLNNVLNEKRGADKNRCLFFVCDIQLLNPELFCNPLFRLLPIVNANDVLR